MDSQPADRAPTPGSETGVQLVRLLRRAEEQLSPLRTGIANFEHHAVRDLILDVELKFCT